MSLLKCIITCNNLSNYCEVCENNFGVTYNLKQHKP